MALRAYQRNAIAQMNTDAAADAAMRSSFGFSAADIFKLEVIADALVRGEKLNASHLTLLREVFPAVPREILLDRLHDTNAYSGSPRARVSYFMQHLVGPRGAVEGVLAHRELQHNRLAVGVAARRQKDDERTREQMAARAARHGAAENARQHDARARRNVIATLLDATAPRFKEPDRFEHADRMDRAAHVLHGGAPRSLHDVIGAAYDSHSALDYGKELGVIDEFTGIPASHEDIGDIGGHE